MAMRLLSLLLMFLGIAVACYGLIGLMLASRLKSIRRKEQLPQPEPKALNPMQVQSVGTVKVAAYEPVHRLCRGCGRPAYLHTDEADFNYCNQRANKL